ncbi:MAG: FtsX-like permease family protein [Pirellulaceae bacterium]|nr:FtsX-like permease family protein [Planctomycetales bacterium]
MKTPLAWYNVAHNKVRTALAVSGVTFAAVLMFMQLGFLGAVTRTATVIYDALDFDILVRSPMYLHACDARGFPAARLQQLEGIPGVKSATPFFITLNRWQNPADATVKRGILTMGVRPESQVFVSDEIQRLVPLLTTDFGVMIDRKSKPEYGPLNGRTFSDLDVGRETELTEKRVQIQGHFALGTGLAANAAVLMSDRGFVRVSPGTSIDTPNLGLIKLDGHYDPVQNAQVAESMRQSISRSAGSDSDHGTDLRRAGSTNTGDIEILTRETAIAAERKYWIFDKSIGIIFMMGVAVAFIVGTAIVYQVLASDVANHLPEYATLKAMGYSNRYLATVVLMQALALAMMGYWIGMLLSYILFRWTSWWTGIPIEMNLWIVVTVLIACVTLCSLSGLGALRKAFLADPADLF